MSRISNHARAAPGRGLTRCSVAVAAVRIFNTTTGDLVSLNDNVAIALDLDARRSIEMPTKVRTALERRHFPEFA